MANSPGPASLPVAQRIATMDILRGVALLGIFIMNMPVYNSSMFTPIDGAKRWPGAIDQAAEMAMVLLFSGKFNSMFSFLFGIGFTIQYSRLQAQDPAHASAIYVRRLVVLACIGLMHACCFWIGDVLHVYAILGLILLFGLRRLSLRAIVGLIGVCMVFPIIDGLVRWLLSTPESVARLVHDSHAYEASNDLAYGQGTFSAAMVENVRVMTHMYTDPWSAWSTFAWYVMMALTMLMGLYVGRRQWVQHLPELMPYVRKWMWWALALGIALGITFTLIFELNRNPEPSLIKVFGGFCYCLCRLSLMVFYTLTVVRLADLPKWRHRLRCFAATGRMPLTNYLLQTLIATTIFYGWGFGLWRQVGPALGFLLTLVLYFAVQVPLSMWWLAQHERGPMEWLWARLTYGSSQRNVL